MSSLAFVLQDPNLDSNQVAKVMALVGPIIGLVILVFVGLLVVPLWFAFKKAGLAPALSLIAIIPTVGLIVALFILAFAKWNVVPAPEYGTAYPGTPGFPNPGYVPQTASYAGPPTYAPTESAPVYPPSASSNDPRTGI